VPPILVRERGTRAVQPAVDLASDHREGNVTPGSDEPTAQAQAIVERVLGLVRECRVVLHALEHPPKPSESSSAEAERIFYFTLMSAIGGRRGHLC